MDCDFVYFFLFARGERIKSKGKFWFKGNQKGD